MDVNTKTEEMRYTDGFPENLSKSACRVDSNLPWYF